MLYQGKDGFILRCDCAGDCLGMAFSWDAVDKVLYISVTPEGLAAVEGLGFWGRLRRAWRLVRGRCYADDMTLCPETLAALVAALQGFRV